MTATNHVVTGALIATFIQNPWIAVPVAFAAHFALDSLPHFDYATKEFKSRHDLLWLMADCALAASVLVTLFFLQPEGVYRLIACGIACASPDLMWVYYILYKKGEGHRDWLARFHSAVQKYTSYRFWPGELVWLLGAGALLVKHL